MQRPLWITGPSRSGKTDRLVQFFQDQRLSLTARQSILALAAHRESRLNLAERLTTATDGQVTVADHTPVGFFQAEVVLFWPLLVQKLDLKAQFPLPLHPENEQELATRVWAKGLVAQGPLRLPNLSVERCVERLLSLLQLSAFAAVPLADSASILATGTAGQADLSPELWERVARALGQWRDWCLARGLLTNGIATELYWQYLLPDASYQQQLLRRYPVVLADDVDNYPAVARQLFEIMLEGRSRAAFSFNVHGAVRLGLGADPEYLSDLASRCNVERLGASPDLSLSVDFGPTVDLMVSDPTAPLSLLPAQFQTIQTLSRSTMLRQTAECIVQAVQAGVVQPREIAILGPGIDAIGRYVLTEILTRAGISVEVLHDHRPLSHFAPVRALLTLCALVYPGLAHLVDRDDVAQMLVALSQQPKQPHLLSLEPVIDPVRAGLLADHCFDPQPAQPHLLLSQAYERWDRLGYQVCDFYDPLVQWLDSQRQQQQEHLLGNPPVLLDRAIQRFLEPTRLPLEYRTLLRKFMETSSHYWQVEARLSQVEPEAQATHKPLEDFIQLIRSGAITATPFPVQPLQAQAEGAVTLAAVFQYRAAQPLHRWQFWLDCGSQYWGDGGAAVLFGYGLFQKHWDGQPWTPADTEQAEQARLQRTLQDLLGRTTERVYLCHSDLSTSGQEQFGPLTPLVDAVAPVEMSVL
ncbi:recombinase family protein [Leptolyngbya sp. FACHB-261]|uniref:recombinase family protein n=1 Tax=Leptolyngbya sp. FACHB-261 TaxID=2692806 RepID=UPI001682D6F9|nr:recombinase family protein [Leptolyngbya sp. FACHB-261]MBD2102741.1 recombinase family protein [Leptolyngbya sp. FACHB-261]